jgi:beta-N-acetylhexosaminidase
MAKRSRPLRLALVAVLAGIVANVGAAGASAATTENTWVHRTLAHMTTAEKVGQLFEVNAYGQSVRDPDPAMVKLNRSFYGLDNFAELIRKYHLGGIIYFAFSGNLLNPPQIAGLSNGVQRVALSAHTPVPLVISTDQEQGEVLRIGSPATVFPGSMALGATRSVSLAHQAALITGQELRAMGVNVDNAPVLDVNVDPLNQADGIRAFADRTPLVTQFGTAQVTGYQNAQSTSGVAATAKHWPGFGHVEINSDNGVATSPQTLAQVKRTNLPPFTAAIRAGVDRIMAAHILFPKITGSKIPTSLSSFWVNGMLRHKLHYNGPVVTDALDAVALKKFSPGEVALRALRAGDDELLEIAQPPPTDSAPADLVSAYKAVLHAVHTHAVSRARLNLSVTRILRMKWKLGLVAHPLVDVRKVNRVVGTRGHLAVARRAAEDSITVIRNSAKLLPLATGTGKRVLVTGYGQVTTTTLGHDIASRGLSANVVTTGSNPDSAAIASAVAAAGQADLIVVSTRDVWNAAPGQIALVKALLGTGKPVVVAMVGTPYDVAYLPAGASTVLASYDFQPISLDALVNVMFGRLAPAGKLPVTIRKPPPSRTVLYPFGFALALPHI